MVPTAALKRRNAAGLWDLIASAAPNAEGAPPDPRDILASDPVLGVLVIGLLPTAAAVLRSARLGAIDRIVSVLTGILATGPEAAATLLACPPLLDAIRQFLVPSVPVPSAGAQPDWAQYSHPGWATDVQSLACTGVTQLLALAPSDEATADSCGALRLHQGRT